MSQFPPRNRPFPAPHPAPDRSAPPGAATKRREIAMFVLLAILIWPVLSVAIVGGYGFLVWISQMILGPPGPPAL